MWWWNKKRDFESTVKDIRKKFLKGKANLVEVGEWQAIKAIHHSPKPSS